MMRKLNILVQKDVRASNKGDEHLDCPEYQRHQQPPYAKKMVVYLQEVKHPLLNLLKNFLSIQEYNDFFRL